MLFFLAGCVTAVTETCRLSYNHLRGDLLSILPERLEDTYNASVAALDSLKGYNMSVKSINTLNAEIIAYDQKARKVLVKLERTEYDQTKIQIRIGIIGDKIESIKIYDSIKTYLNVNSHT